MIWPFKKKPQEEKKVVITNQKPTDAEIESILDETFSGYVPYQWVNWAAAEIGYPEKYHLNYPMTPKSIWVLYEGCRAYKNRNN